jgi:GNAT superfamily N-acetyltransferase
VTVREATVEDTPVLVAMAVRFLRESLYGDLFQPNPARLGLLVGMCLQGGVIFVAETAHEGPVGMVALVALEEPFSGTRYADEVAWWVEPAHRESLVGPRLLMEARNWTRAQSLAFLKMVAPADKPRVGAFYSRLGFQAVETAYIERI